MESTTRIMSAFLVLGLAGTAQAALINVSAGEAATAIGSAQGDGAGTEVILGQTWNNIAEVAGVGGNAPQLLLDSAAGVTALSAFTLSTGSFSDVRGDNTAPVTLDVTDTVASRFGKASNGGVAGQVADLADPILTITGFSALQQLGDLTFYHLVDDADPSGTMTVVVNGVSKDTLTFNTSGTVLTFEDVVANASGEVIITSNNYIGAVTLNTVPEPGSLALLGLGGLMIARRRRS